MSEPLLEIEGLTFRYRRASEPAIRDLTLTVERGEVLLVAGPSGCGKSTLTPHLWTPQFLIDFASR